MRRLPVLTTRLIRTLFLVTVVPFLAFVTWSAQAMRERMESRVIAVFLPEVATNAAERIRARLEQLKQTAQQLVDLAAKTLLREAGNRPPPRDAAEEFARRVAQLPGFSAQIELVLALDRDGRVLHAVFRPGLDLGEEQARRRRLQEADVAGMDWFRAIREGRGLAWIDRHRSPFVHAEPERESRDPADYALGLAYDVQGEEGGQGVVLVLLRWPSVHEAIDAAAGFLRDRAAYPSGQAFLVDGTGRVLAHSERELYASTLAGSELAARVGTAASAHFTDAGGVERLGGFARVERVEPLVWHVGVHAPVRELFATSDEFVRNLLYAAAGVAVLLIVSLALSSRRMLDPVEGLAAATARLAAGDLSVRVAVPPRDDELAQLARAFNDMAEDLSRKRDQLVDAERHATQVDMARRVAHEIKNPLTPMRMSAQLLARALQAKDPRVAELTERLVRIVTEQTEALARIASTFRELSQPPAARLARIAADELLRHAAEFYAGQSELGRVRVQVEPGAAGLWVLADRDEMQRVFVNLVNNSIEACGSQGTVTLRSRAHGEWVRFEVEDDGPGIPAEARDQLFAARFTTKSAGMGLGLFNCRVILQGHGGSIGLLESRPGRTVFAVDLPRQG
ncbi:MAG: sensor histidine kinase [Planctomycetes bacterium]|nr:sensor histidine kinase [Planctomycetota bacterium]